MKKILVLDWSAICKSMAMATNSRKIPWTNPTFEEELAMRICEFTYSLWREHRPDVSVIAQDHGPYWRKTFVHDWYLANAEFYTDGRNEYVDMDGDIRKCEWEFEESGKRIELVKLTAKQKNELYFGTPATKKKEAIAPTLRKVARPDWAEEHLPIKEYKGNRAKKRAEMDGLSWDTYYTLEERLARHIAPLISGVAVKVRGLEADDIATCIVAKYGNQFGTKIVLCSLDKDWHQHVAHARNVEFHYTYDNSHHKYSPEQEKAVQDLLLLKIIGGEPGDYIGGCPRKDRKGWGCVGADSAVAIIESRSWNEVMDNYRNRNTRLIKMVPEYLPDYALPSVDEALARFATQPKESELSYGWTDLGLGLRQREAIDLSADASRVWQKYSAPTAIVKALTE